MSDRGIPCIRPDPQTLSQLIRILARGVMRAPIAPELERWAAEALENGFDSLGLRFLAGLPSVASEADAADLVRQVCEELGTEVPSEERLLELYAFLTAQDILSGALPLRVGCRRLRNLGLMEWIILDEELDLARHAALDEVERNIVAAAKRLIATRRGDHAPP